MTGSLVEMSGRADGTAKYKHTHTHTHTHKPTAGVGNSGRQRGIYAWSLTKVFVSDTYKKSKVCVRGILCLFPLRVFVSDLYNIGCEWRGDFMLGPPEGVCE